jgi:hypothetical protein
VVEKESSVKKKRRRRSSTSVAKPKAVTHSGRTPMPRRVEYKQGRRRSLRLRLLEKSRQRHRDKTASRPSRPSEAVVPRFSANRRPELHFGSVQQTAGEVFRFTGSGQEAARAKSTIASTVYSGKKKRWNYVVVISAWGGGIYVAFGSGFIS